MRVKFKIKAKAAWSQLERDMIRSATHWALHELGLDSVDEQIVITLTSLEALEGSHGQMVGWDKKSQVWVAQDNRQSALLDSLFHELTHVKQKCLDGFVMSSCGTEVFWKNEARDYDDAKDYWRAPWEVEARKTAKKLVKKYQKRGLLSWQ